MAATARVNGQDKVMATAQQIVKSLATSKHAAEEMIRILSGFDNRLSTMSDFFPSSVSGSATVDGRMDPLSSADSRLDASEEVILRWDSSDLLIWESSAEEASEYLDSVDELISFLDSGSLRAEIALQAAMARLEDEFRHLMIRNTVPLEADSLYGSIRRVSLSFPGDNVENFDSSPEEEHNRRTSPEAGVNRSNVGGCKIDLLHPESVLDLKDIADRMFWAGYAKELCQVYSSVRHDILDECISVLGFERMSIEEVQRTEWKALDEKMKKWIRVIQVLVRVLLPEEKSLCEKICAASKVLQEECFTRAAKGCILQILSFGDAISISQRAVEKLFRTLDMYEALVRIIPDLRTLFSADANDRVCIEADGVLKRLGNSIRGTFTEFTNAVQRDSSRKLLQGGDVHPLTRYVMNYVKLLVDYSISLDLLLGVEELPEEDMFGVDQLEREMGPLAQRLLLLLSFLESNVEQKSKNYEDGGLQCIFLMNNILYIIHKVKDSELLGVLGDHWVRQRHGQVKQYATNYLRASWTKILSNLKDDGLGGSGIANLHSSSKVAIKEKFKNFNLGFEEIYRNQTTWKVSNPQLREELRISILEKVIPAYRSFFGRFSSQLDGDRNAAKYVKYTPEELENHVSELFEGLPGLSNHPRRKLSFHHTLSSKS